MTLTNEQKIKLIEKMENMSRAGRHKDALQLHKILGIEYNCILDLSKPFTTHGEHHDVYEMLDDDNSKKIGSIYIKHYYLADGTPLDSFDDEGQDAYDCDSNLMGADWDSEQDYGVPRPIK